MNVLLIQPPDPPPAVPDESPANGQPRSFSPPWALLCLRSYLLEHTRYTCEFIDCRLLRDLEEGLVSLIRGTRHLVLAVVNTSSLGLGQAAAVLDIVKRNFPGLATAICGQHPSEFPEHGSSLPRADFSMAGDPEPILRNLLDHLDVPQRLSRVPGLACGEGQVPTPYWLDNLKSLSLPDWQGVLWPAYRRGPDSSHCQALVRLTRGHTRLPADRAFGNKSQPLREWPLDRLALTVQKAGSAGISEVLLVDPPGVWTPERLDSWCRALHRVRNTQPWGARFLPTLINLSTLDLMRIVNCRRIEFLFPSCDPGVLRNYGCVLTPAEILDGMRQLNEAGIEVHLHFWLNGPEEGPNEADRVSSLIRALEFPPYSLHPYPFHLDSPVYADYANAAATHISDWVQWSRDPWILERPVSLWGGAAGAERFARECAIIHRTVRRHPWRVLRKAIRALRTTNWIEVMEDRALGLLSPGDRE